MVDSQPVPDNGNVLRHRVAELERNTEGDMARMASKIEKLEQRVRDNELALASMHERLTIFQLAQGVWSAVAATAAAIFGRAA